EVDGDTHNGLIEYVDDEDDDDEEAPSFSCIVFTCTQSKKGVPSSIDYSEGKEEERILLQRFHKIKSSAKDHHYHLRW
ncbi:hypothetical protein KI387_010051, partial [Taxus chinensis]